MRMIDDVAIHRYGIPSITLMENAGSAVAMVAEKELQKKGARRVCVLCGKGNNGGDGFVVSRHLSNRGFDVDVFVFAKQSELRGDACFTNGLLRSSKCNVHQVTTQQQLTAFIDTFDYPLAIDALFGTGFAGRALPGVIGDLIAFLNASSCRVLSIDIPSGLHGASGSVPAQAVRADITVTLGLPKNGFYVNEGPRYTGSIVVKNIGFPQSLLRMQ
jgi:NAD(P)H-hydrate epimerase